jgi:hypothetical protein
MNDFTGKQHFTFEAFVHRRISGDVRQNSFQSEMDSLEVAILDLIHLSHSASSDEANDGEAARDYLSGFEAAGRGRTETNGICAIAV